MKKLTIFSTIVLALLFLTGFFFSSKIWADDGGAHQAEQGRPISLGATGGNIGDKTRFFCCGGTLGSLVQDGNGNKYILSNNHVLARTNKSVIGDDISHPGLIDNSCVRDFSEVVADLSIFKTISFASGTTNTVDAAIAQIRSGAVNSDGSILDIGQVDTDIVAPALGMAVKKSGRTTGLTSGTIMAINATIFVGYTRNCGSNRMRIAQLVNQIRIDPGSFSDGGDSGSLIVEDVETCPRPVGLLFAGSDTSTFANPIGEVLNALGVSMVGCMAGGAIEEKSLFHRMVAWLFPAASAEQAPLVNPSVVEAATKVKNKHENSIFDKKGVVGVGIGHSRVSRGQAVIEVYVKELSDDVIRNLPNRLDGVSVEIVETGEIVAY